MGKNFNSLLMQKKAFDEFLRPSFLYENEHIAKKKSAAKAIMPVLPPPPNDAHKAVAKIRPAIDTSITPTVSITEEELTFSFSGCGMG